MARLFIAIALPEMVKEQLAALREPDAPARWTKPEQMHLTLRFVGEVDERRVEEIEAALGGMVLPSFNLQLRGTGCFPSVQRSRVLWAGVSGEKDALLRLQAAVETRMGHAGMDAEPKAYDPHITLARLQRSDAQWTRSFLERHEGWASTSFLVDAFHLYRSELHPAGAVHFKERSFELGG